MSEQKIVPEWIRDTLRKVTNNDQSCAKDIDEMTADDVDEFISQIVKQARKANEKALWPF